MEKYKNLINFELWGNTGAEYVVALIVFALSLFFLKVFQLIILKKLQIAAEKTKTDLDDVFISIVRKLRPPFYSFVALYASVKFLNLTDVIENLIDGIFILIVVYQIINALQDLVNYATKKMSKEGKRVSSSVAGSISLILKITLWTFAILLILSNWGINITSLIAGLGIGGIAIALAVQKILGDIFSSFSIFIDKPFEEGDFIVVGTDSGTVQKIGVKTTRLKTLQGEELVISNQELTSERIRNFKKMEKRRVLFVFGVLYETPQKKLQNIPNIVKKVIEKEGNTEFGRVHFKEFADSSLNFEVVYYVLSGDYNQYMDTRQNINFSLKERFEKEGIEFAYPTQTLFINKIN